MLDADSVSEKTPRLAGRPPTETARRSLGTWSLKSDHHDSEAKQRDNPQQRENDEPHVYRRRDDTRLALESR